MFAAVLMAVAACLTITALANGRKPVASVAVKAVVETSAGTNEIFNVRLASGTNELMEFEAKNGPVKQIIKLSMVNKIAFIEASRANTNYAVFEVFLNATNISKKFEFKVMDNGNPFNLGIAKQVLTVVPGRVPRRIS